MPRYYTKSEQVLGIAEDLLLQEDYALVEKIQREMDINLLDEDAFSDEALWDIAQMSEEEIMNALSELDLDPRHYAPFSMLTPPEPTGIAGAAHSVAGAVSPHIAAVGTTLGSGLHRLGATQLGDLATHNPLVAGAATIGLGAAAALRMRSNAKARAQAQMARMR